MSNGRSLKDDLSLVTQQKAKYRKQESILREVNAEQDSKGSHSLVDRMKQVLFQAMPFKLGFIGRTAISTDRDEKVLYK